MIWTCEVWSDLIGLASAGCMSVPAWQSDSLAGFAAKVRQALAPPAAGRDPNAANVLTELKRLAEEWKPQDRFWLKDSWALYSRTAGTKDWSQRAVRGLVMPGN